MDEDLTRSQMGAQAARPTKKLFGISGPAGHSDESAAQSTERRPELAVASDSEPEQSGPPAASAAAKSPARPRGRTPRRPAAKSSLMKHTVYLPSDVLEDVQLAQARWVLEHRTWIRANGKPTDSGFITMLLKLGLDALSSGGDGQQHLPVDGRRRA